ncbi:MAG: hypothetical protein AB7K09_06355 [Planctomycetota bacterium]
MRSAFLSRVSPIFLSIAVVAVLAAGTGCTTYKPAVDVELVYARKQTQYQPAITERAFNESHTRWVALRGDARATMMVPGKGEAPLAAMPEDMAIPDAIDAKLDYDADAKVLHWDGNMTSDEYYELRGMSEDRAWQQAVAMLYRGHAEVDALRDDRGYDPRKLPAGTYAADDEIMRAVPASFGSLDFFRNGAPAKSEAVALGWFDGQGAASECLILTVDGNTTILAIPNMQDYSMSESTMKVFKTRLDQYRKCLLAYSEIATRYKPANVMSGGDGRQSFTDEQQRLQRQAADEREEARKHNTQSGRDDLNQRQNVPNR